MKRNSVVCRVAALAVVCVCAAGAQQLNPTEANGGTQMKNGVHVRPQGVDLLSDTQGVNFQPYLRVILGEMDAERTSLLPADAGMDQGESLIRLTINPDGTIAAMHLDGSAHDGQLDRAAWGSITGVGKFPALPKAFHGQNLELRVHFRVNG